MKLTRYGTRGYACLAEIDAPAARIWRALTEPALVRIWTGEVAQIEARIGGLYRIGRGERLREAQIDVCDEHRRLRLIYFPERSMPASTIVDDFLIDLRPGANQVALRLLGSGIPEARAWDTFYKRVRLGWERSLARMKVALENPPRGSGRPVVPVEPLAGLDY